MGRLQEELVEQAVDSAVVFGTSELLSVVGIASRMREVVCFPVAQC